MLETLATQGIISPPPADLWERPQAEKDAFIFMLRETIGSGHRGVGSVLRHAWRAWEQEHRV